MEGAGKRVVGVGGVFFWSEDAPALRTWYARHLGINVLPWGGAIFDNSGPSTGAAMTVWSIKGKDDANDSCMEGAPNGFVINYVVSDLKGLLQTLRAEGCKVLDKFDESEYGSFGWVIDPDGNKVELWEPPAKPKKAKQDESK